MIVMILFKCDKYVKYCTKFHKIIDAGKKKRYNINRKFVHINSLSGGRIYGG